MFFRVSSPQRIIINYITANPIVPDTETRPPVQFEREIDGVQFQIRWLGDKKSAHQPTHRTIVDLPQAVPDQQSPDNILNALNDDCLRTIFESNILNAFDLVALAGVCKRFNTVANQVFTPGYRAKHLNGLSRIRSYAVWELDEYFNNFGKTVSSIELPTEFNDDIMFGMISDKCDNIEELYCGEVPPESVDKMRSIVPRLKVLKMCMIQSRVDALVGLGCKLEQLELYNRPGNVPLVLPEIRLPALRRVRMERVYMTAQARQQFLQINPQVEITYSPGPCYMGPITIPIRLPWCSYHLIIKGRSKWLIAEQENITFFPRLAI